MRLGREIERLRQRVQKIYRIGTTALRMVIVKDDETTQELSDWDLREKWRERNEYH